MNFSPLNTFEKAVTLILLILLLHVQNVFKQSIIAPASLQPTYTPNYSSHTISVDLINLFKNGQSVITVIDHFS